MIGQNKEKQAHQSSTLPPLCNALALAWGFRFSDDIRLLVETGQSLRVRLTQCDGRWGIGFHWRDSCVQFFPSRSLRDAVEFIRLIKHLDCDRVTVEVQL